MGSNRSTSTATSRSYTTSRAVGVRSACYVDQAPVMEVLLDQLRYLIAHKSPECPAGCADCERLAGAQSWLLLPFRATATQGAQPPQNNSAN